MPDALDMCKSPIQEDGQCTDDLPPPPPLRVAAEEEQTRFELDDRIYFQANSAFISPAGVVTLHRVAALLKQHREYAHLRILGHADEHGDASYDMRLSRGRALAVRAILIRLGVEEGRIEIRSFGKDRPRALEHTQEANAENRRVEFHVLRGRDVAPQAVESPQAERDRGPRSASATPR